MSDCYRNTAVNIDSASIKEFEALGEVLTFRFCSRCAA